METTLTTDKNNFFYGGQHVNFSFRTAAKLANALKMDFFPDLREQKCRDAEERQAKP